MIRVYVGVHGVCVSGEEEGIGRKAVKLFEVVKEISAIFQVGRDELFELLQMVVDPLAKAVKEGACAADNRPEFVWLLVNF